MNLHRSIGEIICRNLSPQAMDAGGLYDDILALLTESQKEKQQMDVAMERRSERERCAQALEAAGCPNAADMLRKLPEQP